MRRGVLRALALGAVAASLLAGCASDDGVAGQYDGESGYVSGDGYVEEIAVQDRGEPIEFQGQLAGGGEFDSSEIDGPVLVNVWYAACPPCRAEAPILSSLYEEFGDQVTFVGINTRDGEAEALAFESTFEIEYPSILDAQTGQAQMAFAGQVAPGAVPSTLILDSEGRVMARITGAIDSDSIVSTLLSDALAEAGE